MSKEIKAEMSSGNIFRDLGFENPDLEMFKANICIEMTSLKEFMLDKTNDPDARYTAGLIMNSLGYMINEYGGRSPASHLTDSCNEEPLSIAQQINANAVKKTSKLK